VIILAGTVSSNKGLSVLLADTTTVFISMVFSESVISPLEKKWNTDVNETNRISLDM